MVVETIWLLSVIWCLNALLAEVLTTVIDLKPSSWPKKVYNCSDLIDNDSGSGI